MLPETEAQRKKERKRDGDKTTDVDYKDDEETSLERRAVQPRYEYIINFQLVYGFQLGTLCQNFSPFDEISYNYMSNY